MSILETTPNSLNTAIGLKISYLLAQSKWADRQQQRLQKVIATMKDCLKLNTMLYPHQVEAVLNKLNATLEGLIPRSKINGCPTQAHFQKCDGLTNTMEKHAKQVAAYIHERERKLQVTEQKQTYNQNAININGNPTNPNSQAESSSRSYARYMAYLDPNLKINEFIKKQITLLKSKKKLLQQKLASVSGKVSTADDRYSYSKTAQNLQLVSKPITAVQILATITQKELLEQQTLQNKLAKLRKDVARKQVTNKMISASNETLRQKMKKDEMEGDWSILLTQQLVCHRLDHSIGQDLTMQYEGGVSFMHNITLGCGDVSTLKAI